jgi:hypothetical protein
LVRRWNEIITELTAASRSRATRESRAENQKQQPESAQQPKPV